MKESGVTIAKHIRKIISKRLSDTHNALKLSSVDEGTLCGMIATTLDQWNVKTMVACDQDIIRRRDFDALVKEYEVAQSLAMVIPLMCFVNEIDKRTGVDSSKETV